MGEKNKESDIEIHFKDTFRAFSKDNDGTLVRLLYLETLCYTLSQTVA